ncbi:hypothetical protein NL533_36140, partial [Klebsiella pneumoniae]|nr:hypothetical protein [Klebsiella pneumoniae]
ALPKDVQLALVEIVGPTYDRFVVHAGNALERAAGVTLTFLMTLEILDQFHIGAECDLGQTGKYIDPDERAKQIARHL